jgi:hypothetical protein
VTAEATAGLRKRFERIGHARLGGLTIEWESSTPEDALMGTVRRNGRQQPFTLLLRSIAGRPMLRCVSPIGRVNGEFDAEELAKEASKLQAQVTCTHDERAKVDAFAAEGEVVLRDENDDPARTAWLIGAVTEAADTLERLLFGEERDQGFAEAKEDLSSESKQDDE